MGSEITVVSYSQQLTWENGMPVVVGVPITDRGLKELVPAAMSLPYVGRKVYSRDEDGKEVVSLEIEEEFLGMNNAEVMVIKAAQRAAAGDSDETHKLLDRVLGKPKQQNENLNVNASYSDYLAGLAIEVSQEYDVDISDL